MIAPRFRISPTVLVGFALCTTLAAQSAGPVRELEVPGSPARARVWTEPGPGGAPVTHYAISLDGQDFSAPRTTDHELRLRYGRFDPLGARLAIPDELRARAESELWIVQYWTQGIEPYRAVLRRLGVEIHRFLASDANVVSMSTQVRQQVEELPFVRSVSRFQPAFKLDQALLSGFLEGRGEPVAIDLLSMRRGGQGPIVRWIEERGGRVDHVSAPTYLMGATLPWSLLAELAGLDDVQWIDRHQDAEEDMNKARRVHGTNDLEDATGFTGQGVRVEVMDSGCDTTHPDLQSTLIHNGNSPGSHGTCTSGIVAGSGLGNANARGAAPDAFLVVADYGFAYAGGSRYAHTGQLVDPGLPYRCVLQSNSWGSGLTTTYDSIAADMDLILFDHDRISILQSQSNTGNQSSRPQAWAKNIISVGGVRHNDTISKNDDSWNFGGSIGPAADGRIKPDIASFYDSILCTDWTGTSGYSNSNYYSSFGGTSGATPLVAGHLALIYQMWSEGVFGNPTPGSDVFENAPHNTTAKALLINSASPWNFSGTANDLTRVHQGWGHPQVNGLLVSSANLLVVDETDVLGELDSTTWTVDVPSGVPSLRVTLVFSDPPGTTSSSLHRINDLDLEVESPTGTIYHGNVGLTAANASASGGSPNTVDTVENVFVPTPESGAWLVTITASEVNEDAHTETGAVDVDYALVVTGGEGRPTSLPAAPSDLEALNDRPRSVSLSFTDNATNETEFVLERSSDGISFLPIATLPRYVHEYQDTGLAPNATYHYRVHAVNFLGSSADSNVAVAHTRKIKRAQAP
jgi:serine protease AprX